MTDLLPCPNPECGHAAPILAMRLEDHRVYCDVCGMQGPLVHIDDGRDEAARLWNALPRADRKPPTTTEGTSDRVMLAGLAMQGMLANINEWAELGFEPDQVAVAKSAAAYAEALLAELAEGER